MVFFEEWQLQTPRQQGRSKRQNQTNGKAKGNLITIQIKLQMDMLWALFGTTTEGRLVSISEQNATSTNQVTGLAETLCPGSMCTFAGFSAKFSAAVVGNPASVTVKGKLKGPQSSLDLCSNASLYYYVVSSSTNHIND